tara:strand:+ start:74 stop:667 length:594 start_codon:yes stop_codon:yes gene_type:complete
MTLLSLEQVKENLKKVDFSKLPKPTKNNKGARGQLLELALGIENSSNLCDCVDGEVKSFTRGQSVAVTQLKHMIPEIENNIPFKKTKLGKKLGNTLYVAFDNNGYVNAKHHSLEEDTEYSKFEQDYNDLKEIVTNAIKQKKELKCVKGRNNILEIRTGGSRNKKTGRYTPTTYKGHTLRDKYMRFYLTSPYVRKEIS